MRFLRRTPSDAERSFDAAQLALDESRLEEAEAGFLRAIDLGFETPALWFNLGLVYKFRHEWPAAIDANRRCLAMHPRQHEATWNLGVAATAVRDWPTARNAWRDLEIPIAEGDGPPEADFGLTPIRLNATADGGGEVVWGQRIDPCRARIESVPMTSSGHRWHDVVLHDVVPRGERSLHGQSRSVFDELARMDPSSAKTHVADLAWPEPEDEVALQDELGARSLGGEDWTTSIEMICATCSLSGPHPHEGVEAKQIAVHQYALAGDTASILDALRAWTSVEAGHRVVMTEPVVA